jgi:hypothetical protein
MKTSKNLRPALLALLSGAITTAALVMMMPRSASTYTPVDPNCPGTNPPCGFDFAVHSLQDALDAAILKCALNLPTCVGKTSVPGDPNNPLLPSVEVTSDGTDFALSVQVPYSGQLAEDGVLVAKKIKGKDMQRFRDSLAFANALSPVPHADDPNDAVLLSDHTIIGVDPNDPNSIDNADIRITSSLSMKVQTVEGRKGVLTVSVSPSLAVRWDLKLK